MVFQSFICTVVERLPLLLTLKIQIFMLVLTHLLAVVLVAQMWGYSCNPRKKHLLRTERVVSAETSPRPLSATHWTMPLSVPVRLYIVSVLLLERLLSWFLPSSVTITWNLPFWLTSCMLCIHEICGVGNPTAVQLNVVLCWTSLVTAVTTGCGGVTILGGCSKAVWTKETWHAVRASNIEVYKNIHKLECIHGILTLCTSSLRICFRTCQIDFRIWLYFHVHIVDLYWP